ncbi:MAG: hypothetical protein J7J28_02875 [Thaumarchaeota archaeon]|nr:hypothetical protein [Nitrososphaerota archaeon]
MAKAFKRTNRLTLNLDEGGRLIAVDLLKILKSKYNYRKLSTITGFPVSTLTRYLTGKTIPKRSRAEKLLKNLLADINISSLIAQNIDGGEEDYPNLSRVMLDPNIIKVLGAHVLNEFMGMKVTSFLSLDLLSIPLASYLSTATSRPLHIIANEPIAFNGESIPIIFTEHGGMHAKSYWLVLRGNRRRESILAIASHSPTPPFFNSLMDTLTRLKHELVGIFMVSAREAHLKKMNLPPTLKRSYILLC